MTQIALITGAYGYLGSRVREALANTGWNTVALVRTPRAGDDEAIAWRLGEPLPTTAAGTAALVHCAYDMSLRAPADIWRVNVEGSVALLSSARDAGIRRLLTLSSMSAYPGTRQLYGRAKLEIEAATVAVGGIAVRPGLVYGDDAGGMVGTLRRLTRLPVVPDFGKRARQFPVHERDLVGAVVAVLGAPYWSPDVFGVAQRQPVTFRQLLAYLAAREGRRCRAVPMPWPVLYGLLRLGERLRLPLPVRADSLLGLVRPAPSVRAPQGGAVAPLDQLITIDVWAERAVAATPITPAGQRVT
jgi:nucleoside-diphosphate-sugar epimerase